MDKLFIHQLQVETIIGIRPEELTHPQPILVDLEVGVDTKLAAKEDSIHAAKDYAKMYEALKNFISASAFSLVETLAEQLAQHLFNTFDILWLKLTITKKPQHMQDVAGVGITIERAVGRSCSKK